jgi:K(+)-stimulated pyrophosphate-energized sodium pump
MNPVIISLISALLGVFFVLYLIQKIKKASSGTPKMEEISNAIQSGARAFLRREFQTMALVLIVIGICLGIINKSLGQVLAFFFGTFVSSLAGYLGMRISTSANAKTTEASRSSFVKGFDIAFSAGQVMGFLVVSLGLLGASILWLLTKDINILINFAFGSSIAALFLRVGGGIYTKSADIGADLVGKVEQGIPEDDPRNPAVIADQVGDNVGDIAGMGSDLFESYVDAIVSSSVIGLMLWGEKGLILPFILAGLGILSSIVGSFFAKVSSKLENADFAQQVAGVEKAMNKGILIANVLMVILAYFVIQKIFGENNLFWCLLIGLLVGFLIGKASQYYTSGEKKPVINIAKSAQFGAPVLILEGMATQFLSIILPVLGVAIAMVLVYSLAGLYGIAIAGLGVLVVLGINLSGDCYGPIADNAAGIAEMAELPPEVRKKTEALDAVGNTTAAIGKGFAIGSAALVALAWLATFLQKAKLESVNLANPKVLAPLFIGGMISFLFPALLIRAVSRGSLEMVKEVRRQFREIEGLKEGKAKPEHEKCIELVTKVALGEMLLPGFLIIILPILVGYFFGVEGLTGFLAGALIAAFPVALIMANSGAAWDNAKKYIEAGNFGGKGSLAHQASVIGDTIGDPLKDTAGPSINILLKLIGKVALIFLPLFL